MKYYLFILLLVCSVSAITTFIDKGQRPELFELTDNEVAVFRVTLPEDEFVLFKEKANIGTVINNKINITRELYLQVRGYVEFLAHFPFGSVFQGYNFTEILPELKVSDEDPGFPTFDVDEVMESLNITREGLLALDYTDPTVHGSLYYKTQKLVYKRNPDFNITRITEIMESLVRTEDGKSGSESNNYNNSQSSSSSASEEEIFKTKNGTMEVELNGEQKSFNKVTFSIGGYSGRRFGKLGYNFKIRGKDELYGRTQFRLRSDAREPSFLRSKLVCDIQNRLGLPSISANYAQLYINGEFMGLYVMMDIYRPSWVEYEYGEKDTETLYQCKNFDNYLTASVSATECVNRNDEVTDHTQWIEFLTALDEAQSASDIEDIFDIDLFLKQIALEFLFGSWDHFLNYGHNYYLYKPPNDKWKFLTYDFDGELGQDIEISFISVVIEDIPELMEKTNTNYPNYTFEQWAVKKSHLIQILILNDPSRFNAILGDIVMKVFNPATLYPRIDELKSFIRPYVEIDKTPDAEGNYPGRLNKKVRDYTLAQWDANCEFTTIESTNNYRSFGLKFWILAKYRYVCKAYHLPCDDYYLSDNFEYSVDEELQFNTYGDVSSYLNYPYEEEVDDPTPTTTTTIDEPEETTVPVTYDCLAATIGYPCCSPDNTEVYFQDEYGDWGVDFELYQWCGITPYNPPEEEEPTSTVSEEPTETVDRCWSEKLGYNCCVGCEIYEVDNEGPWGIENDQWCGIPSYCTDLS